jgi:UDP-N-acetylmuramoyl-L-alanyl-D-glutamate--2,6-diaminopimelate ligase
MRLLGDILELKDADRALASRAIAGLAFDSRKTAPGDIFFALTGAKDDGLKHVGEAVAKGAAAIVAERWAETPDAAFVAVTGTSGKTSVAAFVRQIWQALGREAASIGTIGVVSRPLTVYGSLTTPDPIALHELLDRLASSGVTNLAIEASSHGLDQKRLDGVRLAAAAFTNLTRDHMDYHPTVEDYLKAKLRLFQDLLPDGASAVIDADSDIAPRVIAAASARRLQTFTVGTKGETIRLKSAARDGMSSMLDLQFGDRDFRVNFPLAGDFQISNALVAAGLCIATGSDAAAVFAALQSLEGAPGRLERIGDVHGATVFVDYAHKPDALEKAIAALRPFVRGRLVVVFGCGGDRDPGKRPIMGEIAARSADVTIVTDDNPRSENPSAIRAQILASAPSAIEIGDRAAAIRAGVAMLRDGDALLIAGKGHETGQIIGGKTLPFSDADEARAALKEAA